jgi:hypothetical protein
MAFCYICILDVVKKGDVKHSPDWNNNSMSNHVFSWSHQQILNTVVIEIMIQFSDFVMST